MEISTIQKFTRENTNTEFKFSIIIPTWNNLPFLKNAIKSIRQNSKFSHQIIVHINEGVDGTIEWVKEQKDIDYTYSKENIGVCLPLNIGRQLLKTDYVVYMNDDMYVAPNWDVYFDEEIKSIGHKKFFLSGTMIEAVSSNPSVIKENYGHSLNDFDEQRFLKDCAKSDFKDWNGASWPINIVHKDIWDLVGGYSIEYSPGFYSDPDFSMKLWKIGIRYFKGLGKSRVYHFPSQSSRKVKKANTGRSIFLLKWGMTTRYFYKNYLKMGTPFNGPLQDQSGTDAMLHNVKSIIEVIKR